jgi:hypothetical protein
MQTAALAHGVKLLTEFSDVTTGGGYWQRPGLALMLGRRKVHAVRAVVWQDFTRPVARLHRRHQPRGRRRRRGARRRARNRER